ncbi:MAG: cupin domain-containing protein [Chloroflexi bacterium]|nr:cupin domain-containing protein [Chloroflexota bacterium]
MTQRGHTSESDEAIPFQLAGEARERALERCREVIDGWGLTMPDVEPLVLDFGLGRFDQIGEIEFWIANEEEAGYCGKFLFLDDGQTCPGHKHALKHETFYIVKGRVRMVVDDSEIILDQGDVLTMPTGARHQFSGVGPALVLEVSMPSIRQDSFFDDRRIADDGVL